MRGEVLERVGVVEEELEDVTGALRAAAQQANYIVDLIEQTATVGLAGRRSSGFWGVDPIRKKAEEELQRQLGNVQSLP